MNVLLMELLLDEDCPKHETSIQYSEMVSLSQKNQKFSDGYFQDSIFSKLAPHTSSDQTKPNQPMWYTTICSASCESIPKKI